MKRLLGMTAVVAALLASIAGTAKADQIFSTPAGATNPLTGDPVSATAKFSLSGNTLKITLTNTIPNIGSAGQLLTGLSFTLSDGSSVSFGGGTGDLVKIASDGTVTDLGVSALGWGFGSTGANTYEICVICTGGVSASATPAQGILGPTSPDGKYDSANSSITGSKPHNPFVAGTGTFTLTVPSGDNVSNVNFMFGTQPTVPTPEPGSLLLLGLGLGVVTVLARRRS